MDAITAKTFRQQSENHITFLALEADKRGCDCQAYRDWFTYRRWTAQGFQVQKGEKSIKLPTYYQQKETDKEGTEKSVTRRGTSCLFCRCQVKKRG